MKQVPYHIQIIRADLSRRQRLNAGYSLRAFGRDLGIHPSTLSQVLNGNRPLPTKLGTVLSKKFKLSPRESTLFQDSVIRKQALLDQIKLKDDERFLLDESFYRVIAEWDHYAVLTLMDVQDFQSDEGWIAKRLGITRGRVETVIQNLVQAGLVQDTAQGLRKVHARLRTTEDYSSAALRASHAENLDLAKQKLEQTAVEKRDYSSITLAIDPEKLPEFKSIIREFREKAAALSQSGKRSEVYQMAIQLFPLTQTMKTDSGESK